MMKTPSYCSSSLLPSILMVGPDGIGILFDGTPAVSTKNQKTINQILPTITKG